jgi:hypothetical protein
VSSGGSIYHATIAVTAYVRAMEKEERDAAAEFDPGFDDDIPPDEDVIVAELPPIGRMEPTGARGGACRCGRCKPRIAPSTDWYALEYGRE